MRCSITSTIILFALFSLGQEDLSRRLDSFVSLDQKWRELFRQINNGEINTYSSNFAESQIQLTDSLNFIQVKKIFATYGYDARLVFQQNRRNCVAGNRARYAAEIFYKTAGWKENGTHGKGEIKFEMTQQDWAKIRE